MNELGVEYPKRWTDFVGQARVVDQIKVAAEAARRQHRPMAHMMFAHSEHGVGKTTLAYLAAKQANVTLHLVQDKVDLPAARMAISKMYARDVLFLDEIHNSAGPRGRDLEWLYKVLEGSMIVTGYGPEQIPPITVIAATTEPDLLPAPLKARFRQPQFTGYTLNEGARIARLKAKVLMAGMDLPSRRNCLALAQAGNCNPRAITHQVEMLAELVTIGRVKRDGTGYDLGPLFAISGITPDGLDELAVRYLTTVASSFNGGPVGADTLAARLGVGKESLTATEKVLQDKGLVVMGGSRGRLLTKPAGLARAQELLR